MSFLRQLATADATSLGYYDFTATYQSLFNGLDIGAGVYSANDLLIDALIPATGTGVTTAENGGLGNTIDIKVTLRDQHVGTGGGPDLVL